MASEEYVRDAGFSGPGELAKIIDFASLWRLKTLEVFRKSPSHVFVAVFEQAVCFGLESQWISMGFNVFCNKNGSIGTQWKSKMFSSIFMFL